MANYRTLRELTGPMPGTEAEARQWFFSPAWKLMDRLFEVNPKMHDFIINRGSDVASRFPRIAAERDRARFQASLPEGAKLVDGRVVVPAPVTKNASTNSLLTKEAFEWFKDNVVPSMLAGHFTNDEWRAYRRRKRDRRGHS